MHPSSGITKEYSVTLDRKPRQEDLEKIAEGEGGVGESGMGVAGTCLDARRMVACGIACATAATSVRDRRDA